MNAFAEDGVVEDVAEVRFDEAVKVQKPISKLIGWVRANPTIKTRYVFTRGIIALSNKQFFPFKISSRIIGR
ncbi:MAG: hypothetical protein R2788_24280 [Saprospiraceae bacterium]